MDFSFLNFLWHNHKKELALVFLVLLLLLFINWLENTPSLVNLFNDNLRPIVSFSTFLAAVLIWWGERKREWRNEYIPKKLTVYFQHNNQPVMECHRSSLLSEADLRAWSQQIGAQMSGNRKLDFKPYFKSNPPIFPKDDDGNFYKLYSVRIDLNSLPKANEDNKDYVHRFEQECKKWIWTADQLKEEWSPKKSRA